MLEEKLFAAAAGGTSDEEMVAVRAEADRDLVPYRRKMSAAADRSIAKAVCAQAAAGKIPPAATEPVLHVMAVTQHTLSFDALILGGGAAGLMCAIEAGKRGRRVAVLEHADRLGKKILISGGGRCNFTNIYCQPENFLSANPHFAKSALARYTPADFIALVEKHRHSVSRKDSGAAVLRSVGSTTFCRCLSRSARRRA